MSSSLAHLSQYSQALINCVVACDALNKTKTKQALELSHFDHDIKAIAVSDGLDVKYMVCSTGAEKKQLIVAFCDSKDMSDFLLDIQFDGEIEGCEGALHSSIYRR